jgi:hypothetical protein
MLFPEIRTDNAEQKTTADYTKRKSPQMRALAVIQPTG